VAEQSVIMRPGAVPHHGPVSPDCPIDCLMTVLSLMSFHPLARAYDAPFDPPRTVGDVIGLYTGGQLPKIRGLGRRRISEIEAALVLAGLDITGGPAATRAGRPRLRAREDGLVTMTRNGLAYPPPLPLWWSRAFPGEPPLVRQTRSWIAGLLPACPPLDDLLIVASELATNAVAHTRSGDPGGWFTVEVTWSQESARVVVGDQGSGEIPVSVASPGDQVAYLESGRGLLLVDALSAAWGIAGDTDARWLWADVEWRSRGVPLPMTPSGNNSVELQFAELCGKYPGTLACYSQRSGEWRATLPKARDADDTISAPSPGALTRMLAARCAAARSGIS
jgi:serine/threonine-protein kinase RsbW